MFDTVKFGAFLANLRKNADLTQSELADRLGLTRQAISRYECGDSFPDISILREIAGVYQIPVSLLISAGDPTDGEAEILRAVAEGRDVKEASAADINSLAPWLKPSILNRLAESMGKQGIDISALLNLSEYMTEADTRKLMQNVTFDSLSDMDPLLLERLLPLLGPYASETVFHQIIEGELDYHYLEMFFDYSWQSQVEAAVVYGALPEEALDIMKRNHYNRARMNKNGSRPANIIRLFRCPFCQKPLPHFYPRRCSCGKQVPFENRILRCTDSAAPLALDTEALDTGLIRRIGAGRKEPMLILLLGVTDLSDALTLYYESDLYRCEFVILDSDLNRLSRAEREIHAKNYGQLLFVHDHPQNPHLIPGQFDLIIDNTSDHLGQTDALKKLLKEGGVLLHGSSILLTKGPASPAEEGSIYHV